jgi:hypothetical protein
LNNPRLRSGTEHRVHMSQIDFTVKAVRVMRAAFF